MVEAGSLDPSGIYTHPQRNVIYRSIGQEKQVIVDTFTCPMSTGDVVVLCTDGLWEMVPQAQKMEEILNRSWLSASDQAAHLIRLAKAGGGQDNIGVVVVQIGTLEVQDMPTLLLPPQKHSLPALAS
jgi:protein phosphatase